MLIKCMLYVIVLIYNTRVAPYTSDIVLADVSDQ